MIWEVNGVEYHDSEVIPVPIILLDRQIGVMKNVAKKHNDSDFIRGYECALEQFEEFASEIKDASRIE